LTLILGPVENVIKHEKLSDNAKDQLHIVQSNADRMLRLINQILDFRKIQNKKMRLKIQPTRFDKLIKEICANFSKEALDKNIDFRVNNKIGDVILWIDRDKTDIIIYNLLSNAFKYTPENRKIEVVIEKASNNGDVQIKVIDQGVGIPREKRTFLFERFTSANEIHSIGNQRGKPLEKEGSFLTRNTYTLIYNFNLHIPIVGCFFNNNFNLPVFRRVFKGIR
jgi:signal transduction histidine kinase